jgi:hypothetical protein
LTAPGTYTRVTLRFVNRTTVSSIDDLPPVNREQLRQSGLGWDGLDLPAADRLDDSGEEHSFLGFCERWDVVDPATETLTYEAWFYMVDSGTFFRAGTDEVVAEVIQFGLECDDDRLRPLLGAGMVEAKLLPRSDSAYDEFAEVLAAQRA